MKALKVVVPIVAAGAVLLVVVARMGGARDSEAYRLERDALRREMLERSVVARGLSGPQGAEEARAVVRWWTDSVTSLHNRHPKQRDAQERPRGGAAKNDAEWRQYADERLADLRAGYAPALSASDAGLRLDVLSVKPGENPQTHERALRIDFALWGAPRRLEREEASGSEASRPALRVSVPVAFRRMTFRFVDAAGKTYGEMSGAGDPYLQLKDPERFSADLPPGIVLGTWWVDLFPREAARVELSLALQAQGMTSAVLAPTFRWEVAVPEEWKLRPGEAFHAEMREAPPEPQPSAR
jgi:hypothetical protein